MWLHVISLYNKITIEIISVKQFNYSFQLITPATVAPADVATTVAAEPDEEQLRLNAQEEWKKDEPDLEIVSACLDGS